MTYKGRVKNGVVVLEEHVSLPDDAEVRIELVADSKETGTPWADVLQEVIGSVDDWPEDMAANHDHYIHGAKKR
jgi:uncharacterized lipoprotein YbaY